MSGVHAHTVTTTHCPYCALNCGLGLTTEGDRSTGQVRWKGSPLTGGALSLEGLDGVGAGPARRSSTDAADASRRRTWSRSGGRRRSTLAADGFLRIRDEFGPDANAVLSGGSLTNEKAYLMGKFARLALRTRHIDYNGRFCMVSAGSANIKAFGMDRAMTPLDELVEADVIVVVGANLSDAYPVMLPTTINKARQRGARVVAIDPRFGRWVQDDDMKIAIRPGTDGALFLGLLSEIERQGLLDVDFINSRTVGFFDAIGAARPWHPDDVEAVTDVPAATVRALARLIGSAERCMILHARGPEQQTMGTDNVLAMINLALACGHIGKPSCGINMLTGQRNGQGGREWGQRCNQLPAGRSIADLQHRAVVAERWGVDADDLPGVGATYVEILQMAGRGEIKGLLSISNNMSVSAPDLTRVDEQMSALRPRRRDRPVPVGGGRPSRDRGASRHHVRRGGGHDHHDRGARRTVRPGGCAGPAARRHRHPAQPCPPARCRSPVQLRPRPRGVRGDADGVGRRTQRLRGDHVGACPRRRVLAVPRRTTSRHATAVHRPVRPSRTGWPGSTPSSSPRPPVLTDDEYPLVLTTGRLLAHYLSGNQTKRIPAQQSKAPGPYVELHPDTAAALGLTLEDRVELRSRQGRSAVPWRPNDRMRADTVFMPYHWRECNVLVAADLDPTSKIPGFKYTPISVTRLCATDVVGTPHAATLSS